MDLGLDLGLTITIRCFTKFFKNFKMVSGDMEMFKRKKNIFINELKLQPHVPER